MINIILLALSQVFLNINAAPAPKRSQIGSDFGRAAIKLQVRADVRHSIYYVREEIRSPGSIDHLRYAKWIPGHHSASGPIPELVGLHVTSAGSSLPWRRDPLDPYKFDLPAHSGPTNLAVDFIAFQPLKPAQGRVRMTPDMLDLDWNDVLLFPGDDPARVMVSPRLQLPQSWETDSALTGSGVSPAGEHVFAEVPATQLVDSPLIAAQTLDHVDLGAVAGAPVEIAVARTARAPLPDAQTVAALRASVKRIASVFGAAPFRRYAFLMTLSDLVGGQGFEHGSSSEIGLDAATYAAPITDEVVRTLLPHELIHAWNGKFDYPLGESHDFITPMNNGLLWVYEGLTDYYAIVVSARAGLLSPEEARDTLAERTAGWHAPGWSWRSMEDATNSEIISPDHTASPWPDEALNTYAFYDQGSLVWLDADATIRRLTENHRSLDDFARSFFRVGKDRAPRSYTFADVIASLNRVAPYDWKGFFDARVYAVRGAPPDAGIEAAGWRLAFGAKPDTILPETLHGFDLMQGLGLSVEADGRVSQVRFDGPAFRAGLIPGATITGIGNQPFRLQSLISAADSLPASGGVLNVTARQWDRDGVFSIHGLGGLLRPHIERLNGTTDYLSSIFLPHT